MSELSFIWAEDLDGWIGKDNKIPWHVPADMKFFKETTMGHPIIMGRRTFASMGDRPLPGRKNIILTRQHLVNNGITVIHSVAEMQALINQQPGDYFVIGGANVYQQVLAQATRLYRTVINQHVDGDTKMPTIDYDRWHLVHRDSIEENGSVICWFEEWRLNVEED
jgi:dihydrofolate reductase